MPITQGGWDRNIKPGRKYPVIFAGRNTHVAMALSKGLPDDEVEANLDLIAAAPKLLAALRQITHPMSSDEDAVAALELLDKLRHC